MDAIKNVAELKKYAGIVVEASLRRLTKKYDAKKDRTGKFVGISGFTDVRIVAAYAPDLSLRVTARHELDVGDTEMLRIGKDVFFGGGLTNGLWDKLLSRYAKLLADNGKYPARNPMTSETPTFSQVGITS